MPAIDDTYLVRKRYWCYLWELTDLANGTWWLDLSTVPSYEGERYDFVRAMAWCTGDRTVTPKPYQGGSLVTADPGDDPLDATTASYRPMYRFSRAKRIDFVVAGSTGSVYLLIEATRPRTKWEGKDLP